MVRFTDLVVKGIRKGILSGMVTAAVMPGGAVFAADQSASDSPSVPPANVITVPPSDPVTPTLTPTPPPPTGVPVPEPVAREVTPTDLQMGEDQLKAMLKDRPMMADFLKPDDEVWKWVVRQLAGEYVGKPILWSAGNGMRRTYCLGPTPSFPYGEIHVANLEAFPSSSAADAEWAQAVFEMFNIRRATTSALAIDDAARAGKLDRNQYILAVANCEYLAMREGVKFYTDVWKPHCEKLKVTTRDRAWHYPLADTFDGWIAKYPPESYYPWKLYGKYFDGLVREPKAPNPKQPHATEPLSRDGDKGYVQDFLDGKNDKLPGYDPFRRAPGQ